MKLVTAIVVALMLSVASAPAQAQCQKNLGTLTLRQFDSAVQNLFSQVDRNLKKSDHYIYTDATKTKVVARELTSDVDVTREARNVVDYAVCRLNSIGIPTWLANDGTKLIMKSRIYIVY